MTLAARNEDPVAYVVDLKEDEVTIARALQILERRMAQAREVFTSPETVKSFLCLRMGHLDHEVFGCLFVDAQNRLIAHQEMFRGTLTQTSVYPREIVKECLVRGAASVVLFHNHPSGSTNPSRADEALTQTLKAALSLVDVRVLDHIIVGGANTLSFAERGLL